MTSLTSLTAKTSQHSIPLQATGTPRNAPEPARAFTRKCGMAGGQIKAPVTEKCFRPYAIRAEYSQQGKRARGQEGKRARGQEGKIPNYTKRLTDSRQLTTSETKSTQFYFQAHGQHSHLQNCPYGFVYMPAGASFGLAQNTNTHRSIL
jgi:hypothetical protein